MSPIFCGDIKPFVRVCYVVNICSIAYPASILPFFFEEHPSPTLIQMGLTPTSQLQREHMPRLGQSEYSITVAILIGLTVDT